MFSKRSSPLYAFLFVEGLVIHAEVSPQGLALAAALEVLPKLLLQNVARVESGLSPGRPGEVAAGDPGVCGTRTPSKNIGKP